MSMVLPHESANDAWTPDEELSGRKAFDGWRFMQADRVIPWDWADMGAVEKSHWIERGRQRAPHPGEQLPPWFPSPGRTSGEPSPDREAAAENASSARTSLGGQNRHQVR